jgi:hypothetical protein
MNGRSEFNRRFAELLTYLRGCTSHEILIHNKNIVAYLLKARNVKPTETAVAK